MDQSMSVHCIETARTGDKVFVEGVHCKAGIRLSMEAWGVLKGRLRHPPLEIPASLTPVDKWQ